MNKPSFGSAVRIFAAVCDVRAWAGLHRRESDTANPTDESVWRRVDAADAFATPFETIRLVAAGHLDPVEIVCVLGCLGYALRATLAGDEVGLPAVSFVVERGRVTNTVLDMSYDSANSIRTEPDPALAFDLAAVYVREGTPPRKTSRSGPVGSRLVEGIGERVVEFHVRCYSRRG